MFLQIFGQVIIPIIIVFITLTVIKKILENGLKKVDKVKEKLKNEYEDINKYILIIVSISAILYLLLIAKIVPFLSIRYFLLIVPLIYYYKNFYEVNSDITRYINGYNIYFSEIDKIDEKNNSSIEEIKKKDKINVFLYNTHLDKIDEILQKLDGKYKIIKENKTFYGKMYLLSK